MKDVGINVFRHLANVLPTSKVEIDEKIEADIRLFIEKEEILFIYGGNNDR